MSAESRMRMKVCELLAALHAVPIENSIASGTPDVNCTLGWLELKYLPRWPATVGAVRVDHFTGEQRLWLRRRKAQNGACWVLLRVGNDWLLFDGAWASAHLGHEDERALKAGALHWWYARDPVAVELVTALITSRQFPA